MQIPTLIWEDKKKAFTLHFCRPEIGLRHSTLFMLLALVAYLVLVHLRVFSIHGQLSSLLTYAQLFQRPVMLFHSLAATISNYCASRYYKGLMQIKSIVIVEADPINETKLLLCCHNRSLHYLQDPLGSQRPQLELHEDK